MDALLEIVRGESMIPEVNLRRLHLLSAHAVRSVDGDLVECGVYKGGSAAIIGQAALEHGRQLWLFDSFQGMPPTTAKDGEFAATIVGLGATPVEGVRQLLDRAGIGVDRYILREGLFAETFQQELPQRVAFLHIDADWYESVLASLRTFYDRVEPGGVIVLDDFGFWEGCREAYYDFVAERGIKPLLERCGVSQAYWLKGRNHNRDGFY